LPDYLTTGLKQNSSAVIRRRDYLEENIQRDKQDSIDKLLENNNVLANDFLSIDDKI